MKILASILILSLLTLSSLTLENENLLQKKADEVNFERQLIQNFSELNYPTYHNREFWEKVPLSIKKQYIENASGYLDYDWPVVKATDYLEIIRSGGRNQQAFAAPRTALLALVMGELIEGKGRFIDQIVNGSWYYCEQTWWGWSAHLKHQKSPHGLPDINEPLVDLGVGEITNILSWTWYLFKDEFDHIHPLIAERLKDEIMKKAVIPYYQRDDFWWMGLTSPRQVNNWVPWVNHNMLTAILILEDDQEKRIEGVKKVIRSLDVFLNQYPEDGGCDEGPTYWGHSGATMFKNLDLLKRATNGAFDLFDVPKIEKMGSYIYKAYIAYPYFINFADADASTGSYPDVIYSYGKAIDDPKMQEFGAYLAKRQDFGEKAPHGKIDEQISQLMWLKELEEVPSKDVLISDFWLPQTQIAGGRDKEGSSQGFFFAAKGGHNGENHNHNDVGSCVMYYNGKPCLIDLGREKYVAKTFSPQRYEIWTMQSQFHNTPRINGQDQSPGAEFKAVNSTFKSDSKKVIFATNIAGAYSELADVKKWERTYLLKRGKSFTIQDDFELVKKSQDETTLNLITYCKVSKTSQGNLQLEGEDFKLALKYNPNILLPKIEFIEVTDESLKKYWPDGVTRIVFTIQNQELKGKTELLFTQIN
ncbi:heparinase II/III domain-containing protein [Flexithrix dorotheae]|uniref:heparinase II/III domain-containing protein n=1 Tax=Flexithrix dorotheae TaxID=70993 RepID=UPI000366D670|nr:heparinase II/III family protein [Flexithrix dorotheae]